MKLLLDENLSRRLVPFLQTAFPGSTQVALVGLERASDQDIWQYAQEHDFVIVTKDSDYYDFSMVLGAPPYVLWLQTGNAGKSAVLGLLLNNAEAIQDSILGGSACVELTG
jgi:predicted nuclease of predicted toxin-antitoxin system